MFTDYTFEDWLTAPEDKRELIQKIIDTYRGSAEFRTALTAQAYFATENEEIKNKFIVQLGAYEQKVAVTDPSTGEALKDENGNPIMETRMVKNETKVEGTRISSGFFFRLVTQQSQHLLATA